MGPLFMFISPSRSLFQTLPHSTSLIITLPSHDQVCLIIFQSVGVVAVITQSPPKTRIIPSPHTSALMSSDLVTQPQPPPSLTSCTTTLRSPHFFRKSVAHRTYLPSQSTSSLPLLLQIISFCFEQLFAKENIGGSLIVMI